MHSLVVFFPPSICIAGYAISGGVTWYSLREIERNGGGNQASIPKSALFTAVFFIASLIHIPATPPFTSFHLVLNGMMGTLLGYYAFLAIPIGLFFQAVMFQHGGMSTLGVNTIIMGVPAIAAYHLFRFRERIALPEKIRNKIFAFLSGILALMLSATIFSAIAILTITPDLDATLEQRAIFISLISYGIQGLIEGTFTFMLISFLEQVKPELLKI